MAIDLSGPGPGTVYPQTVSEGTAIYVVVMYLMVVVTYMGQIPQDGNFGQIVSYFSKK